MLSGVMLKKYIFAISAVAATFWVTGCSHVPVDDSPYWRQTPSSSYRMSNRSVGVVQGPKKSATKHRVIIHEAPPTYIVPQDRSSHVVIEQPPAAIWSHTVVEHRRDPLWTEREYRRDRQWRQERQNRQDYEDQRERLKSQERALERQRTALERRTEDLERERREQNRLKEENDRARSR